jgi:hypothetical protein
MHQFPWLRLVGVAGLLVALMLFLTIVRPPFRAYSDETLTTLVNAVYGTRQQDTSLHELAHERAQYQVTYSGGVCDSDALTHDGLTTPEVLACNTTGPERAVEQWQGSPTHHEILSGDFTHIGCGSAPGLDGAWFYACTLSNATVAQPTPAPVVPDPPAEQPTPSPVLLPDTATGG